MFQMIYLYIVVLQIELENYVELMDLRDFETHTNRNLNHYCESNQYMLTLCIFLARFSTLSNGG